MFKKGYHAGFMNQDGTWYVEKTCKTKFGRWFFVKKIQRQLKKEGKSSCSLKKKILSK